MNKLRSLKLLVALSPGIFAASILAQTTNTTTSSPPSTQVSETSTASPEDNRVIATQDQPAYYAAAIDGTGLIALDTGAPGHFLFGVTVSGGRDSNPDTLGNGVASPFYTASPYLAAQLNTAKSQYLFQYQLTTTGYNSDYGRQTLSAGSARIVSNPSERLSLGFDSMITYGQDAVRFLGSQQTVPVGDVAGTGPNSAAYLPNAGHLTYINSGLGGTYHFSSRNSLQLLGRDSYGSDSTYQGSNSISTASVGFDRDLSPTLGASVYVQNYYYYGSIRCESYGAGVGLEWKPREKTAFSLTGGPQFDAPECNAKQGFSFNASMNTNLNGKSQLYLLAGRQPATSYLGPGLWQDNISGGYQRQVTSTGLVNLDMGYVSSTSLVTVNSYSGTYFDCIYSYGLGHGLLASYTYRGYFGDSGGTHIGRNLAMFSLNWAPRRAVSLFKFN